MTSIIIFGHPRSRTNLICSHIESFPEEILDLTKVNSELKLDWAIKADPRESIYSGLADRYLQKLKNNTPPQFKVFGFHLHNWPQSFSLEQSLKYPVLRVYRKNKFEAILSLLIGQRRGFTSYTQKNIEAFDVTFVEFQKAFAAIVTHDNYWKEKFNFAAELEYEEIPAMLLDGALEKFGIRKNQIHKLKNQESIKDANQLIKNIGELHKWNELMYAEKF